MITPEQVVAAIYITEGGTNTSHPYGIMAHYKHTSPHDACLNTVNHALRDYKCVAVDRAFITFLCNRYCPEATDPVGHKNWEVNMVKILHL